MMMMETGKIPKRLIQVGLGDFGWSWLTDVIQASPEFEIAAIVDRDLAKLEKAQTVAGISSDLLFTDLQEAITTVRADFLLNVTPPRHHGAVIRSSLAAGLPVLCEKPMSDSLEEARDLCRLSVRSGVPVMIAENYRYSEISRALKSILDSGIAGPIHNIEISFRRKHRMHNYHATLEHPLLLDVAIHHFDMLRYFTGKEGVAVECKSWTPEGSWYSANVSASVRFRMEDGIKVSYDGSLDADDRHTDWNGIWRFEGEQGTLHLVSDRIMVNLNSESEAILHTVESTRDSRKSLLLEFAAALDAGRPGETDIRDNMRTFELTCAAIRSASLGQAVAVPAGDDAGKAAAE